MTSADFVVCRYDIDNWIVSFGDFTHSAGHGGL